MSESKQISEYMNTKGFDPEAISLDFDDNAFSTDDIVCNDSIQSGQPGGKIYTPHIHDAYHTGADSINSRGS